MAGVTSTISILIGHTIVQFPASGSSSNWSPAIIQFAELVSVQLKAISSPFDIPPTVQVLTANNATIELTGNGAAVNFPFGSVRSFTFTYALYQTTTDLINPPNITVAGTVVGVYSPSTSSWTLQHEYIGSVQGSTTSTQSITAGHKGSGQAFLSFDMDGSDKLLLTTYGIFGSYDPTNSKISYSAKTELTHT